MSERGRGFRHSYPTEKLLAWREVPAVEKLRWLQEMREFLDRFQPEDRKELMRRFRDEEI